MGEWVCDGVGHALVTCCVVLVRGVGWWLWADGSVSQSAGFVLFFVLLLVACEVPVLVLRVVPGSRGAGIRPTLRCTDGCRVNDRGIDRYLNCGVIGDDGAVGSDHHCF